MTRVMSWLAGLLIAASSQGCFTTRLDDVVTLPVVRTAAPIDEVVVSQFGVRSVNLEYKLAGPWSFGPTGAADLQKIEADDRTRELADLARRARRARAR